MDDLDRRLRALAGDSLDRESAAVRVDDDLALVRARAAERPTAPPGKERSWARLAVAATLVLFVGGAVALLATRDSGEEVVAPVDALGGTATSSPPTIGPDTTQVAPPAVAEPSTVGVGWTVSITPSAEVVRTCQDIVSVSLRSEHEAVPIGQITPTGWDTTSPSTIPACEGVRSLEPLQVEVPDLPHGEYWFCIAGDDTRQGCAIVTVASVTTTTIATTATTSTTATTTTTGTSAGTLPVGYYVRVPLIDEWPYFTLREVDAGGAPLGEATDAEIEQLLRREVSLGAGRTIRLLRPEEPYGRCDDRPVTTSGPTVEATPDADLIGPVRSLAATDGVVVDGVVVDGVVVVGVDVCPDGATWGDPGTRFELRRIDVATGTTTVLHVREPGDGDTSFEDRDVVYAGGEFLVESVSPDGAWAGVAEPYTTEDTRYHVFDARTAGDPIELGSACPDPRDLVGPPQFVGDDLVVLARECSPVDTETGSLIVELVSLATREPVWSVDVDHVAISSYTSTVSLSATDVDGRVWALVSGSAGVEQPIRAAAVTGGVEQPLPGEAIVAFDPRDLLSPWDPTPPEG